MKATTVRLDEALLKAAKIHAIKTGVDLQDLVAEGLRLVMAKPSREGRS